MIDARPRRTKLRVALGVGALLVAALALWLRRSTAPVIAVDPLLVDDPMALALLERDGLAFDRIVGDARRDVIARTVASDMAEFTRGQSKSSPRRPFKAEWLSGGRARFELTAVVNRIDRRRFAQTADQPDACGEVRLVYRLALQNPGRPVTRLPMTVNVRIPQPRPSGMTDCRALASPWRATTDLLRHVLGLAPGQIEINYQSIHVPGSRTDMDDSAEYVLRSFEVTSEELRPGGLFNTPRSDVDKDELVRWVAGHLREIDDGSAVLPKALLATRSVSVSPRGLVHPRNRPYSSLLSPRDLDGLPLGPLHLARTPELLLRRLDEATCPGCHQMRGVAGFHLLGEERSGTATFNALAVGHSPHLGADLGWRKRDLSSAAKGELGPPRPFAAFPNGERGAECGLAPGFSSWTCHPGLVCRDIHHGDVGECAPPTAEGPGDPCEDVAIAPSDRPEGPLVIARSPDATCPAAAGEQRTGKFCAPNWLGFTGGVCSERCDRPGERLGAAICAPLPAAGYEADCFLSDEPVESCLKRHLVTARVASCDADHPCRDDYGCARVPGAPPAVGACVPPYFIFQARVDGPRLDR